MSSPLRVCEDSYYDKLRNYARWIVPVAEPSARSRAHQVERRIAGRLWSFIQITVAGIEGWLGQWLGPALQIVTSLLRSTTQESAPRREGPDQPCFVCPDEEESPSRFLENAKKWANDASLLIETSIGKAERFVMETPLWVYGYILFIIATIAYIANETAARYRGVQWLKEHRVSEEIREGCREFILSDSTLREVMAKMRAAIEKGLNPKTKFSSSMKCFTTYVQDLPTGREKGKFLALDLGGTNFRVLLITLNGRHFDMQSKIYAISQETMTGSGESLFDHIAQCLYDFMHEHRVEKENLGLGFTFSFPLLQIGLSKGILQSWTKGFSCSNVVGEDVVSLLKAAIDKRGDLKIDVVAILNDTTGTLMSCAWKNHNCKIGVILGTGTNACYVEKIENVINFDGDKSKPMVIINCEWGAFGDNGELEFITTSYDKEVDNKSINAGKQLHEKLISGMYLGEIVRLLIVKFAKEGLLFGGRLTNELNEEGAFLTKYISSVESDKRGTFKNCRKVMEHFGYTNLNDEECNSIRYICECVSRRAAHLASAGLATLINKMGHPSLTIGVDGSLYRYHPHFHDLMVEKISQLVDSNIVDFSLMLSSDGSGRGAALVAASAKMMKA